MANLESKDYDLLKVIKKLIIYAEDYSDLEGVDLCAEAAAYLIADIRKLVAKEFYGG